MSLIDYFGLLALIYLAALAVLLRKDSRKARKHAEETEAQFQQLFDEAPFACHEIDRDGVIRRVNRKLCELRGVDSASIVGKHCSELVAGENERARISEETQRKLNGDLPLTPQKQTYIGRDGAAVTLQAYETLMRDATGEVVGLRSSALDVTEHI